MPYHPKSGFHYLHVMASVPTFDSIREVYQVFAERCSWTSVIDAKDYDALKRSAAYQDPNLFVVTWVHSYAGRKEARKAKVACLYAEALGPRETMVPNHVDFWDGWVKRANEYDMLLGHTPFMAKTLGDRLGLPSGVFPVGWEPSLGSPDFGRERRQALVYYGSYVGKRAWAIPSLKNALGDKMEDRTGTFKGLRQILEGSLGALYVAHSDVDSFSTWRTWQALPTGAGMIGEVADLWPLENGIHYVGIPRLTPENADAVGVRLRELVNAASDIRSAGRRAWEDIGPSFTVERCMEDYLVPASMKCL